MHSEISILVRKAPSRFLIHCWCVCIVSKFRAVLTMQNLAWSQKSPAWICSVYNLLLLAPQIALRVKFINLFDCSTRHMILSEAKMLQSETQHDLGFLQNLAWLQESPAWICSVYSLLLLTPQIVLRVKFIILFDCSPRHMILSEAKMWSMLSRCKVKHDATSVFCNDHDAFPWHHESSNLKAPMLHRFLFASQFNWLPTVLNLYCDQMLSWNAQWKSLLGCMLD